MLTLRDANRFADLLGEGDGAEDGGLLEILDLDRVAEPAGDGAHLDRDRPRQPLGPGVVDGVDDGHVAMLVGDDQRRRGVTVERQRYELDLRVGAAHAVAVDHRQTELAADREGEDGVDAADLDRHHGADWLTEVAAHRLVGGDQLAAHGDPLEKRHRRPDGEGESDEHVIRQLVERRQRQRAIGLDGLDRRQLSQVGVAAAASAEHRRAAGDVFDLLSLE